MEYKRSYSGFLLPAVTILVTLNTSLTVASAQKRCEAHFKTSQRVLDVQSQTWYKRDTERPQVDYFNVKRYLAEKNRKDIFGLVETEFSTKFDTRFYYSATSARKNKDSAFEIDPKAKAVFIFFHGSGTAQSSGKNFYGIMNSLGRMGFAALSMDLPFHGNGSLNPKLNEVAHFMKWVDGIVREAKASGKPVYLVGHSFGPDVIAEYIARYPQVADGALLMSPAGFNKTLSDWYDNFTSKMKFGGEVPQNEAGGLWAGTVSSQFGWARGQFPDASVVNPRLKVHMLSGDREEYVPAPIGGSNKTPIGPNTYDLGAAIREHFKNADVVIEKGIGHYIFNHTDQNGHNVVMREILRLAGENIANSKKLAEDVSTFNMQMTSAERALVRFSYDGNFRTFVQRYVGENQFMQKMKNGQEFVAKNIIDQYDMMSRAYEMKMAEFLVSDHPVLADFQYLNKGIVDQAKKNMKDRFSPLLVAFHGYLENRSPEQTAQILAEFKYEHPARLGNFAK